ncbi:hypothetical protein CALCODRAFT_480350 [Calocera cornea HHB12733]|uniref:Uncharacterized protein n=1 Tax=Calocera cornea HHB12733 TaxID=1353952 RepID=A0A165ITR1_9BASI|nr:hypothetical protein CALCODRAFT_480350 [Calocera cornea HHB12733]
MSYPNSSPMYIPTSIPLPIPMHVSGWPTGSPYSPSPALSHTPPLAENTISRSFADAVDSALGLQPSPVPDQLPSKAQPGQKRKRKTGKEDAQPGKKVSKGRVAGSRGYGEAEIRRMVEAVEEYHPIGSGGWQQVMGRMTEYWFEEGVPARSEDSVKRKFAEMSRMPKPTGDPDMHELILRAKKDDEDELNQDDSEIEWPPSPNRGPVPEVAQPVDLTRTSTPEEPVLIKQRRHVKAAPKTESRHATTNALLANVSRAFDPDVQAEREQRKEVAHAQRSLYQSEILSLRAQLLEKDKLIESLRTQLLEDARSHLAVQRELDGTKARLEMQEQMRTMMMGMGNVGAWLAQPVSLAPNTGHSSTTT